MRLAAVSVLFLQKSKRSWLSSSLSSSPAPSFHLQTSVLSVCPWGAHAKQKDSCTGCIRAHGNFDTTISLFPGYFTCFKIGPKVKANSTGVVVHIITHQTQPTSIDFHHLKGFQDWSICHRDKRGVKITTNPDSPCNTHPHPPSVLGRKFNACR